MANEAVLMVETALPVMMTCADGAGIEKGTVLKLADLGTVSASGNDNEVFGGIAAEEKIASDGKTKIAVYYEGIFKMFCGAAGNTVGKLQSIGAVANAVVDGSAADNDLGYTVGKALETATTGETFLVFVGRM